MEHGAGSAGGASAAPRPAAPAAPADANDARRQADWAALTDVERTALQVAYWRAKAAGARHPATGRPLFDDPHSAAAAAACIPAEAAAALDARDADGRRVLWMGIRTAEVDRQVLAAAAAAAGEAGGSGLLQVVILGAGLDARAWRLRWPAPLGGGRVVIFEADKPAMLALKRRALGGAPAPGERREVPCDLRETNAFQQALASAGFDPAAPTAWLLEGLIGYFTPPQALALLRALRALSGAGSRAVVTAPPTQKERDESAARGTKLHHSTFEPAEATLARAAEAGWRGHLVTWEELRQRYGTDGGQQVLLLEAAPLAGGGGDGAAAET